MFLKKSGRRSQTNLLFSLLQVQPIEFDRPLVAPASAFESLNDLFSSWNVGAFLLGMAYRIGSTTYRLRLPIPGKDTFSVGDGDTYCKNDSKRRGYFQARLLLRMVYIRVSLANGHSLPWETMMKGTRISTLK